MKGGARLAALAAVSALLLAAAPASAGDSFDYTGNVEADGSTFFGFDVVKANGKTKVNNIQAGLAYTCRGRNAGSGLGYGKASGSLKVKNGKFRGSLKAVFLGGRPASARGENLKLTYEVTGKAPENGLAKGTISSELKPPANRGVPPTGCYTGVLDWQVSKVGINRR